MNLLHFALIVAMNLIVIPSAFSSQDWIALQCEYIPTDVNVPSTKTYKFKYYIHEQNKVVKDENLNDRTTIFDSNGIQMNMANEQLGKFKIFISPDYQSSTLFIQSKGTESSHFKATCQSSRINTCDLYPDVCYPTSNRGF